MKILDSTAGARSMWYQKNPKDVVFLDMRKGKYRRLAPGSRLKKQNDRDYKIKPTVQALWEYIPFKDNTFDMVIFDPPHIFKKKDKKIPSMAQAYGCFIGDSWRQQIERGAFEFFRVLKNNGFLILKWCEIDKSLDDILKLFPYPALFGTRTGQYNNTHWICFIKCSLNRSISDYDNSI